MTFKDLPRQEMSRRPSFSSFSLSVVAIPAKRSLTMVMRCGGRAFFTIAPRLGWTISTSCTA